MSKNTITNNGVTVNNGVNTKDIKGFSTQTLEKIAQIFPSMTVEKSTDILSKLVKKTNFNSMTKDKRITLGYYYILDKKRSLVTAKHNEIIANYKSNNGWNNDLENWSEPTQELITGLANLENAKHEDDIAIKNAMSNALKELNIITYNRYVGYINCLVNGKDETYIKKAYIIDMAEFFISLGLQPSITVLDDVIRAIGGEKKRLSAKNNKLYGSLNQDKYTSTLVAYLVEIMIDRGLIDLSKFIKDEKFLNKITDEKVENIATTVQNLFEEIDMDKIGNK